MVELGLGITGVDVVLRVMDAIESDMEDANGVAVVAGGRVIQKEAQSLVKVRKGGPKRTYLGTYRLPANLKKSIKIKLLKARNSGQRAAIVGPAVGKRQSHDGFYGVFVEDTHYNSKPGQYLKRRRAYRPTEHTQRVWKNQYGSGTLSKAYTTRNWKNAYGEGNLGKHLNDLEFGTSKTKASPFMRPAFDNKIDEAQEKMAEVYKQVVDRKFDKGKAINALGDIFEGD